MKRFLGLTLLLALAGSGCSRAIHIEIQAVRPAENPLPASLQRIVIRPVGGSLSGKIAEAILVRWKNLPHAPSIQTTLESIPQRLEIETGEVVIASPLPGHLRGTLLLEVRFFGTNPNLPLWTFANTIAYDSHSDPARVEREIVAWTSDTRSKSESNRNPLPAPTLEEVRKTLAERAVEIFFSRTRPGRQRTIATFFRVTPRGSILVLLRAGHLDTALTELVARSGGDRDLDGRVAFDIAQIYRLRGDRKRALRWIRMARARGSDPAFDRLRREIE